MKNDFTASELGYLWTGYSINEMSKWYLSAFQKQSKDKKVKDLFKFALDNTNEILKKRKKILSGGGYPIPIGFSEKDIDDNTSSLFSDRFLLFYLHSGTQLGLEFHSKSLALATRADIRSYHSACIESSIQINERVVQLLLNKGFYWKTPSLQTPASPEYITKTSYLNGWFGDTRPMNSMEIANLYFVINLLIMMETLFLGFAQISHSDDVKQLFFKGSTFVNKHYNELSEFLMEDHLPTPPTYTTEITDTKTTKLFSDRIMVTHMAGLFGSVLSQYGFSLGSVMRHDLLTTYLAQMGKAGSYSEKITRFLIENEWVEKVPGVLPRRS